MLNSFFILRLKRKIFPYLFIIRPVIKILPLIFLIIVILKLLSPVGSLLSNAGGFLSIVFNRKSAVLKSDNNLTNILIMGIGGGNHEGAQLTDSIIVASLNVKEKNVSLITIPRDLWIDEFQAKINTAYEYGEKKKKGVGIILSKATVEEVLGIPMQYGLVVDFHAFEKIVDAVGGVDMVIDTAFEDDQYPIEGKETDLCGKSAEEVAKATEQNVAEIFPCRFEKLVFNKGQIHMNGSLALKFVRSRHAKGDEGTDFARSKRQMKLIEAIKTKIVKPEVLLNPSFFTKMSQELKDNIDSDLSFNQMLSLAKNFSSINISQVKTYTLDTGTDENPGPLINPPVSDYGAWVLVPRLENWNQIHEAVKSFLEQ